MVPLAAEANGLEEDRSLRVKARDLERVTDNVPFVHADDPADGFALARTIGDRPGRHQTVDSESGPTRCGHFRGLDRPTAFPSIEFVLEGVGHDSRQKESRRYKFPYLRNSELDEMTTYVEDFASETDTDVRGRERS